MYGGGQTQTPLMMQGVKFFSLLGTAVLYPNKGALAKGVQEPRL